MKKIAACFTLLFSTCFHHQCDMIRLDKGIDEATEIKEFNIDKKNGNVSFKINFLGKYSGEYKLADIYDRNFYYDKNLVHSDEELLLDSLSNLDISKFIIQNCEGKWRFVGDLNQYKNRNGEAIIHQDNYMFAKNFYTIVKLKEKKIDSTVFYFKYDDFIFDNKRIPDKFRLILLTRDSALKPILLYSNWIS